MDWWQAAPAILCAAALLLLPGLVVGAATGARGLLLWGSAGPVSVTLIALAAVGAALVEVAFTLPVLAALTALTALLVFGGRALFRQGPSAGRILRPQVDWRIPVLKVGVAAAGCTLLLLRLIGIFGHPDNISQTLDNVFHLNLVRFVLDTGNGSTLDAGRLTNPDATPYPAAWHDAVALTASLTAVPVPVAVNAVALVVGALVWVLGVILLGASVCGNRVPVWIVAAAAAGAFPGFPYLMLEFGVLYPNYLSLAMLPALLALCAAGAGKGSGGFRRGSSWLLFFAALPGLALAHPSSVLALIALTLPILFSVLLDMVRWTGHNRGAHSPVFWGLLAAAAGYLVFVGYVWTVLRPPIAASGWQPYTETAQAVTEGVLNAPLGRSIPVAVVVLTFLGIGWILRKRKHAWVIGVFGISVALFTVAAGVPWSDYRSFVVGNWYNDSFRLAAILPVAAIGLAVAGGASLLEPAGPSRSPAFRRTQAVAGILVLCLLAWTNMPAVSEAAARAAEKYEFSSTSPLLTTDERELLNRVDTVVPEHASVVGSPWTGAALVYVYAGRQTLAPHVFSASNPDTSTVMDHFDEATHGGDVCAAIQRLNAYYALDFGTVGVHGEAAIPRGVDNLAASPSVELVDQVGEARLYRVTACGPDSG